MRTRSLSRWSLVVLPAVVGALVIVFRPSVDAAFPGNNGKIAFVSKRAGGDMDVFVMNADGSSPADRTLNSGIDDADPQWSPDGKKLVFQRFRNGGNDIFSMNEDGTSVTAITSVDNVDDEDPAWSPGATNIAFETNRDTNNDEIYRMSASGASPTRLTMDAAGDFDPDWSNTDRIAWTSTRDGDAEIFVMDGNGASQAQLTTANTSNDFQAAWSPDGTKIAFVSNRNGNSEIYVMNANGGSQTRLTDNPATEENPAWSPDGTKILFDSDRDNNKEIYVMNADGSAPTRLTNDPADDFDPNWGPTSTASPSPSASPSGSPSASPTGSPGASPTASPTGSPGASPTGSPTASPGGSPTPTPTGSPGASPTASPSASPTPSATLTPTATAGPTAAPAGTCDGSYPTVCIPPPPPKLSCLEVPFVAFTVRSPDPHGFDDDRNGVGCPGASATLTVDDRTVTLGQQVEMTGGGFTAGSSVGLFVTSTFRSLGVTTADSSGRVRAIVTVPRDLPAGAHTLVAKGRRTNDFLALNAAITVRATGLPITGATILRGAAEGLALLAAGSALASSAVRHRRLRRVR